MSEVETIRALVEPLVAASDLDLYDVELSGNGRARVVRVTCTCAGGVDIDSLTELTRRLGPLLDASVTGPFELEVSSPGIERALKTPEHFTGAIGETISVKYSAADTATRERVVLEAADDTGITVITDNGTTLRLAYGDVLGARTVFDWSPKPKPKGGTPKAARPKESAR